jgi:hypothetical protein
LVHEKFDITMLGTDAVVVVVEARTVVIVVDAARAGAAPAPRVAENAGEPRPAASRVPAATSPAIFMFECTECLLVA